MKINKDKEAGYHYMTKNGCVLSNCYSQGLGDSLGRTAKAALIYDEDRGQLLEGISDFYTTARTSPEAGEQIYVVRINDGNPEHYVTGNSRDHVMISMSVLKELGKDDVVKQFIKGKAKRPCINHPYTTGQKIWFKALYSHFWSLVYALGRVTYLSLMVALNKSLRAIGGYTHYDTLEDFNNANVKPNKIQRLFNKVMYPTYAALYSVYGARVIKNKKASKLILKTLSKLFEKNNYVAKALCGEKINPEIVKSYIPSRKNRWSTRLDETNDRDMRTYNDNESSNMELAMLIKYIGTNE